MPPLKTVVSIGAGATVTVLGVLPTAALVPVVGFLAGETIGSWLPPWLWVLPLLAWPVVGGGVAAAVRGSSARLRVAVGSLAGALGCTVLGTVVGLGLFVLAAGMTPAHTQTVNVGRLSATMVAYGAGSGFLVGAVLGAIGGGGAYYISGIRDPEPDS